MTDADYKEKCTKELELNDKSETDPSKDVCAADQESNTVTLYRFAKDTIHLNMKTTRQCQAVLDGKAAPADIYLATDTKWPLRWPIFVAPAASYTPPTSTTPTKTGLASMSPTKEQTAASLKRLKNS